MCSRVRSNRTSSVRARARYRSSRVAVVGGAAEVVVVAVAVRVAVLVAVAQVVVGLVAVVVGVAVGVVVVP